MSSMSAVSPSAHTNRHAEGDKTRALVASSTPPRPPVPPRRHTLAEMCRYADEQCAYIEWMTRQLEAEEAARCHSCPPTPLGAITNPFSGPADMWWRPTSANEMYGKSALRRQQEAEQEMAQSLNPYLAMNGLPELVEKDPAVDKSEQNTTGIDEPDTETILPMSLTCEPIEIDEVPGPEMESEQEFVDSEKPSIEHSPRNCKLGARLDDTQTVPTEQPSSNGLSFELPHLERNSMILMIPKAMMCFLLLPLVLMIVWVNDGCDVDGESDQEDG